MADQAGQPILNRIEMGMPDERAVVDKLVALGSYRAGFEAAFLAALIGKDLETTKE